MLGHDSPEVVQPRSKEGGRSVHCWKLSSCISQGHNDPGLVAAHIGGVNSWISSASYLFQAVFLRWKSGPVLQGAFVRQQKAVVLVGLTNKWTSV